MKQMKNKVAKVTRSLNGKPCSRVDNFYGKLIDIKYDFFTLYFSV